MNNFQKSIRHFKYPSNDFFPDISIQTQGNKLLHIPPLDKTEPVRKCILHSQDLPDQTRSLLTIVFS